MNTRSLTAVSTLGLALLASCYPYDESQNRRPRQPANPQTSVTSVEQQQIQAQRDALKKSEELKKVTPPAEAPVTQTNPTNTPPQQEATPKPPVEEKRNEYAIANKVPGKDGFVFSPYNNKIVDVRDIPSGTLVQDPTYTGAGKGYFRVP
jgi:hypothetical protein